MATEVGEALSTLRKHSADVQQRLTAVQEHVTEYGGDEVARDGVSLLQLKSAALLRYCANLSRYGALRLAGSVPTDALRSALCADWATLERIRPLEKRLRPQLDALVAAAKADEIHRPNAAAMIGASDSDSDVSTDEGEDKNAAYVPPRFAETVYDGGQDDAEIRRRDEARRERMRRGAGARAMMAELRGFPEEIREPKVYDVTENREQTRFEEDNFIRLSRTKKQRKQAERAAKITLGEIEDINEGLLGLERLADGVQRKSKSGVEKTRDPNEEMEQKVRALDQVDDGGGGGGRGRTRNRRNSSGSGSRGSAKRRKRS